MKISPLHKLLKMKGNSSYSKIIKKKFFTLLLFFCFIPYLYVSSEDAVPKFIVMRHGEATHNVKNVYNSNPDHPNYQPMNLTKRGKYQAKFAAKKMSNLGLNDENIARVYVSPLPRTRQTADVLANEGLFSKNKIVVDRRLIEIQMGELEGKPRKNIPHDRSWKASDSLKYPGETYEQVAERVADFYKEIIQSQPERHVIIVTHGAPSMALIEWVTNEPKKLKTAEFAILPLQGASVGGSGAKNTKLKNMSLVF